MRLIRDDAQQKLTHALTTIRMLKITTNEEMRRQHIEALERSIELCLSYMKDIGASNA